MSKGINFVTLLVSVPLSLRYLGTERFGLWMTIISVAALLNFADLGIGNGILNAISEANGNDDLEAASRCVSSGFFILSVVSALIGIVFLGTYPFIAWAHVFNVSSPVAAREAGPAMAIFFLCFVMSIPLGIVQRVQLGYQEGFKTNAWQAAGSLMALLGLLIAIAHRADLPWLVLAVGGAPLLAASLNCAWEFTRSRPWLRPRWNLVDWGTGRKLGQIGFLFFVLQIAGAVAFSSDNLLASQILGPSAAARYSVAQRLFMLAPLFVGFVLTPLWPAYGEALTRGDKPWVRRTFLRSLVGSIVAVGAVAILLTMFATPLFSFWVGSHLTPPLALSLGLATWSVVYIVGTAISVLLNAANVVAFQVVTSLLMAVTSVGLKVFLGGQIGIAGIIWGLVVAYCVCSLIPTAVYIRRRFRRDW